MLGTALSEYLGRAPGMDVIEVSRGTTPRWDAVTDPVSEVLADLNLTSRDFVINASGWIPQRSSGNLAMDEHAAKLMNCIVPGDLDSNCRVRQIPLLQIATDCVFSGKAGPKFENSMRDSSDLYGLSKICGEDLMEWATLIRCSIVGQHGNSGLFNWLRSQTAGTEVLGYVNHLWNGVSTLAFAKLARAWITYPEEFKRHQHWVPGDFVSKYQLLKMFSEDLPRTDLRILEHDHQVAKDMRLGTVDSTHNFHLWSMAGYREVPNVRHLVSEFISEVKAID